MQISAGLAASQLLPAVAAVAAGIPAGLGLYIVAGGDPATANPPILSLLAVVPATLLVVAALTAIPADIGAHRSIARVLAAE